MFKQAVLSIFLMIIFATTHSLSADETNLKTPAQALNEFAWEKRQIIVFTPSLDDSRLTNFETIRKEFADDFSERFLQVWIVEKDKHISLEGNVRNDLLANTFYQRFNVSPDEFLVVLIGYDQGVKLRQSKFNVDFLLGTIDQMPMRKQEMQSQ